MEFNPRPSHLVFAFCSLALISLASAAQDPAPCAAGLAAFEKNLHAPILRVHCVECHDVSGPGPAHSVADPATSYKLIKTYVDFTQPVSQSYIVSMVQQKHWLDYDKNAAGATPDVMEAALQAWWDQGESTCPDEASPQTAALAIPANLPSALGESYVPLSWKLDGLGGPFVGSQFEVEIQSFSAPTSTTPGAYRLRKPRFSTPQAGLLITGLRFFINGKVPLNADGWENIQARIAGHVPANPAPGADPFSQAPVLSGRPLILLQDKPQGDVITVSFVGVNTIPAPRCQDLTDFQQNILPAIQSQACVSCHDGGTPSSFNGGARLSLSGTDAQICAAALERADFVHANASPFYLIGFLDENDHPPTTAEPYSFSQAWEAWVAKELPPSSTSQVEK